ncbi:MAG: hypothetical protein IJ484_03610, partial [Oscillospiraceae bacterium]|nr:hypothetical protein [Oscillospiraceae bacterium]
VGEQLVHARWQELAPWPENAEPEWLCLQDCDRLSIQSKLDELSGAELVLCLLASDRALQRTRLQYVRAQLIRSGRLPADAAWPEGYGPEDAA